ncbi:MinD/ParA family ATP-binding protein [Chitinibacteraceae bacterium HSL-7]
MAKGWAGDQASGLRAMVARPACRSISFSGGRGDCGTTTLLVNLAAALTERMRHVVVLDEFSGTRSASRRLGLIDEGRFERVLRHELTLADALLRAADGFDLLSLSASPAALATLNDAECLRLERQFDLMTEHCDYLLIDTRPTAGSGTPSLSLASEEVVVIVTPRAESITDAYTTIKRLATEYARERFRILVNRVPTLEDACAVFNRIRDVAKQFLGNRVELKLCGFVPEDDALRRAGRLNRTVIDAFPDAESATAFRQLADAMLRWKRLSQPVPPTLLVSQLVEAGRSLNGKLA